MLFVILVNGSQTVIFITTNSILDIVGGLDPTLITDSFPSQNWVLNEEENGDGKTLTSNSLMKKLSFNEGLTFN